MSSRARIVVTAYMSRFQSLFALSSLPHRVHTKEKELHLARRRHKTRPHLLKQFSPRSKQSARKQKRSQRPSSQWYRINLPLGRPSSAPNFVPEMRMFCVCVYGYAYNLPSSQVPKANSLHLRVDVHLGGARAMPGSEEHAAAAALVLDVLERVHDIGNAAQADEAAETESPSAVDR